MNQFHVPSGTIYKSSAKFSKDGNRLYVQNASKLISYSLPTFTTIWEKDAPQPFREHQLEVYGDDEIIAAWEASGGLGFVALFGAFPRNLPDVSVNDVMVTEGDSGQVSADFTVTLSAASTHKVTVSYSTAADSASQDTDFTAKTGTVVFQPGETSKTISVDVSGDNLDEPNESFKLNLNSVDVGVFTRAQATGTILDNDPEPTVSVGDVEKGELDFNSPITFRVTLSQPSAKTITLSYATADGTAIAGTDYTAASGTITFTPGQTLATVQVNIIADIIAEPTEVFFLNLSMPTNVTIVDGQAMGMILNDDVPGIKIGFGNLGVNEFSGSLNVTVFRKGDNSGPATADYQTSDSAGANPCSRVNGAASSRCDYITTFGTLRFEAGETTKSIRIPIINDVHVEGTETFTLTLSNPVGTVLSDPSVATINILDNDTFPGPNPIDGASFFVRQHYVDFLNREPDGPGLTFWTNEISSCGSDQACIEVKRIKVSAAFFLSIEFQGTGYLVYRTYKSAFGNLAGKQFRCVL